MCNWLHSIRKQTGQLSQCINLFRMFPSCTGITSNTSKVSTLDHDSCKAYMHRCWYKVARTRIYILSQAQPGMCDPIIMLMIHLMHCVRPRTKHCPPCSMLICSTNRTEQILVCIHNTQLSQSRTLLKCRCDVKHNSVTIVCCLQ